MKIIDSDVEVPNKMTPEKQTLLYTMFHIKNRPFDQVCLKFSDTLISLFFSCETTVVTDANIFVSKYEIT